MAQGNAQAAQPCQLQHQQVQLVPVQQCQGTQLPQYNMGGLQRLQQVPQGQLIRIVRQQQPVVRLDSSRYQLVRPQNMVIRKPVQQRPQGVGFQSRSPFRPTQSLGRILLPVAQCP